MERSTKRFVRAFGETSFQTRRNFKIQHLQSSSNGVVSRRQQGTPRPIPVPRGHVAGPWPLHGLGEERARHAYILQQPGTSKKRAGMLEGRCKRGRKGEQKGGKMEPLTGGKKRNK